MRFEDEPYVRLYKRDTTTWLMLPWQARCILPLILRKVDRAGLLELDDHGVEGLAVMIAMPVEIVEAGLPALMKRDILRMHGTTLVWPKYIEAQEAAQSDKVRQQASRSRARDVAAARAAGIPIDGVPVTIRDEPSQFVTDRHVVSHAVTSCHSEMSRDEQSRDEEILSSTSSPAAPAETANVSREVREVFDYWSSLRRQVLGLKGKAPTLDQKRRRKVQARLREGYSVRDLHRAIEGMLSSTYHLENGFTDLELCCRDATKVDFFLQREREARLASGMPMDDDEPRTIPPPEYSGEVVVLKEFRLESA